MLYYVTCHINYYFTRITTLLCQILFPINQKLKKMFVSKMLLPNIWKEQTFTKLLSKAHVSDLCLIFASLCLQAGRHGCL